MKSVKLRWSLGWYAPEEGFSQITSRRPDGSYYVMNMEYERAVSLCFVDLPRVSPKDILNALYEDYAMVEVNPGWEREPECQAMSIAMGGRRSTKTFLWKISEASRRSKIEDWTAIAKAAAQSTTKSIPSRLPIFSPSKRSAN